MDETNIVGNLRHGENTLFPARVVFPIILGVRDMKCYRLQFGIQMSSFSVEFVVNIINITVNSCFVCRSWPVVYCEQDTGGACEGTAG